MNRTSLAWIDDELASLEKAGLRRRLSARQGPQTATIHIEGRTLINFGANDYLGLAADQRLVEAVRRALEEEAWGGGASPLVTGRSMLHAALERRLAQFEGTEAALLFPSGFAANSATIAALAGKGDALFSDAKNHASIIDGCRLSGAEVAVYRHGDVDHLAELLAQSSGHRRRLIVTDSLFSMDGDLAPLPCLAELAERYDAMLLVDEAHATGVFGKQGRGVSEHFQCEEGVDIRVGTLSKALGSMGGFVAGPQNLIDLLANRARGYVFSTAAPAAMCAAGLAALDIIRDEPNRRRELLEKAERLRAQLLQQGWDLGSSTSQILPVYGGDPNRVMGIVANLREQGLLVPGIRPPTVPEGESLLRISLSWSHTEAMLERLLEGMQQEIQESM